MAPEDRKAALVDATLALLLERGAAVSTREIAEAAGVAEGTIFRVFPSKEALLQATLEAAMDPGPLLEELAAVDRSLPLRPRLVEVVALLQHRIEDVIRVVSAVGLHRPPALPGPGERHGHHRPPGLQGDERVSAAVVALLEPDAGALRCSVREAARVLRLMTFAGSHPLINGGEPLRPADVVAVVLDGVLLHEESPSC